MEWLTDPTIWVGFGALVVLEVVLGIDNLIFIAILADRLPPHQRDKARIIGLSLALFMRLGLLASVAWIVTLTEPLFSVLNHAFAIVTEPTRGSALMSTPSHALVDIPSNIYKPNAPLEARVLEHFRLTAPDSPNEVTHIVLDIAGSDLHYLEGQSIGVLPPGEDAAGKPHKLRLYSIASPSYGDDGQGSHRPGCRCHG